MDFEFVFIYRHIYRKWVLSVDSKCRNTVILTGLTYTSSRKVFHDGCAKRGIFSHQKFNKNRLSLAHCALNRSFTVLAPTELSKYEAMMGFSSHILQTEDPGNQLRRGYLGSTLLACRAVARPHIQLEICIKHKYHTNVYTHNCSHNYFVSFSSTFNQHANMFDKK